MSKKRDIKLQSYVKASLKSHSHLNSPDMVKLNNYYYMKETKNPSHHEVLREVKGKKLSHKKSSKLSFRSACVTSKQSTHRTPKALSPPSRSPKKIGTSKQSKSGVKSSKNSLGKSVKPKCKENN